MESTSYRYCSFIMKNLVEHALLIHNGLFMFVSVLKKPFLEKILRKPLDILKTKPRNPCIGLRLFVLFIRNIYWAAE